MPTRNTRLPQKTRLQVRAYDCMTAMNSSKNETPADHDLLPPPVSETVSKAGSKTGKPADSKWLWVVILFFLINVFTTDSYSTVWMDEVLFTDPAANLYHGQGFTSTAWPTQSSHEFWSGNLPLHTMLLSQWFKIFGFGMKQTRIFGYLIWALAVGVTCMGVRRMRIVENSTGLCWLAAFLFLGQCVTFSYRTGRYDPLHFFLVSICFYGFSIPERKWRYFVLFASSLLFLPAGAVLGPYSVMLAATLVAFTYTRYLRELLVIGCGVALGGALLYLFYSSHGTWDAFLRATTFVKNIYFKPNQTHSVYVVKALALPGTYLQDKSAVLAFIALIGIAIFDFRHWQKKQKLQIGFIVALFLMIPCAFLALYAFPFYYNWTIYVPVCIGLVSAIEKSGALLQSTRKNLAFFILAVGLSLFGLPFRLILASFDPGERDYNKVEEFVTKSLQPADVVYADYQAFYPLQKAHVQAYYSWYLYVMSPQEKASINCIIVDPAWSEHLENQLGGQWKATGEQYLHKKSFGNYLDKLLPVYFTEQTNQKYNLAFFRRVK